jgi:hypothetical protein
MEYLIAYLIGAGLWFIVATIIRGYMLVENSFFRDVKESLFWGFEVLYFIGPDRLILLDKIGINALGRLTLVGQQQAQEDLINACTTQAELDGYTYPIDELEFENKEFFEFIELLKKDFTDLIEYDFSDSMKNLFKQFMCEDFVIFAQGNSKEVFCSINSKSIQISQKVFSTYKTFYKEDLEVNIYMGIYYSEAGRTQNTVKSLKKKEIADISDSYYPYINNDIMYKQFFNLQENILILAGKPGIGKSKMASSILKYATANPEIIPYDKMKENESISAQFISVCYVKSTQVLCDDIFWRELSQKEFDFVIIDDLDYFLTSRDSEVTSQEEDNKNKFLNQFLSFTDGIEKHKTKFIITTNQPFADIDSALLRKGRLFDILELRDLSGDEALVIWEENKLLKEDFLKLYSSTDRISPADIGSEISKRLNTKITEALEPYVLEDNISKVKQTKFKKKVGFN